MHPVIRFQSRLFNLAAEPKNPINPIHGWSLLEWLRTRVPTGLEMSAPDAEDWGWYAGANWQGRSYMIGACANESDDGNHEWVVQIEKSRSMKERLLGRAAMSADDPCFLLVWNLIEEEPAFTDVAVERDR